MALLVGFGHETYVVERIVVPLIGKALVGPRPDDDFQELVKAPLAFPVGNVVALVGYGHTAASDSELESSLAHVIKGGGFLGDSQWVAQGKDINGCADLNSCGPASDCRGDDEWSG